MMGNTTFAFVVFLLLTLSLRKYTSCPLFNKNRIEINAKFCWGCCYRAPPPFCCGFPTCCYIAMACCCCSDSAPVLKKDMFVENSKDAIRDIKDARDNAKARMQIK